MAKIASIIKNNNMCIFFVICCVFCLTFVFVATMSIGCYYTCPNAEVLNLMSDIKWCGLQAAAERLLLNYDGRYFTNILHGLNPMAYGNIEAYHFMPLAGLLLLFFSSFFWIRTFLLLNPRQAVCTTALFCFIHWALSPDITSELFNTIATYVYLYGICLWLIWTGATYNYLKSDSEKKSNFWFVVAFLGLLTSGGTNEQLLLLNSATLAAVTMYFFFSRSDLFYRTLPLMLIGLLSVAFFVSCPGWRVRLLIEEHSPNQNGSEGLISHSLHSFLGHIVHLITGSWALFAISWFLIWLTIKTEIRPMLKAHLTLWGAALIIAALYGGTLVYFLAVQNSFTPPGRIYCLFYTILQLFAFAGAIWIPAPKYNRSWLASICMCLLCITVLLGENNYSVIFKEYNSGEYEHMYHIYHTRLDIIDRAKNSKNSWQKACFGDEAITTNLLYYPVEISPNRQTDYANIGYEKYFDVDEVCLCLDTASKKKWILNDLP